MSLSRDISRLGAASAAVLGLAALCVQPAAAAPTRDDCRITATPLPLTWSIPAYNPFNSAPPAGLFAVQYKNDSNQACSVSLRVDTASEPYGLRNANNQTLDYTLIDASHGVELTPDQGDHSVHTSTIQLGPGKQTVVQYEFAVDVHSLPADGLYQQRLVFDAQGMNNNDFSGQMVTLQLQVVPAATISLLGAYSRGAGGSANVDLGDLKPGVATTRLSLLMQSTRGYQVEARSRNGGMLELGDDPRWAIPYQLVIGQTAMNLASPASLVVRSPSLARQDTQNVGFVIGSTDNRRAGEYADTITLSIAPY